MSDGRVVSPIAPGRPGVPVGVEELRRYLDALGAWRDGRRAELDRLDAAALDAADPDGHTPDITLAMALWQAVAERHDQLLAVWDSGRVGQGEREQASRLIWGSLDQRPGMGMSVSLVEACRLSDALVAQLRTRLDLDPVGLDVAARIRSARVQLERVRDLVRDHHGPGLPEDAQHRVDRLTERLDEAVELARRGADVTGRLGPLETDLARTERDLIVGPARARQAVREEQEARLRLTADVERAGARRTGLLARQQELRDLARLCRHEVRPAPRLAVPDVAALGPIPGTAPEIAGYLARLARVERAVAVAEAAYTEALARRKELRGLLDGYRAMAAAAGRDTDPELLRVLARADAALRCSPCDLDVAAREVGRYQALVRQHSSAPSGPTTPASPAPREDLP